VRPPKYHNIQACRQNDYLVGDLHPVRDGPGIPINNPTPPEYKAGIEEPDFSLDKAAPQFATTIDEQIERDDAGDDFVKEKPHSNIRSPSPCHRPRRRTIQ
jgi:hypothetical protein